MKSVFITGTNGLLGTNLTHALLDEGFKIYALIRDLTSYKGRKHENLEFAEMGLWGDYRYLLEKSDIVVHIAADTSTNKTSFLDYEKVNYKATKRIFDLSKESGVKQFVYISTANTIGYGNFENPGREGDYIKKPFDRLFYSRSKAMSEDYLLKNKNGIDLRILNPTFMIGPYDSKPSSGKIIKMGLGRRRIFYPPGGKNFVPVKDVVQAILISFKSGKSGEKYLIAGENLSYKTFFKRLRKISGEKQVLIPLPVWILRLFGCFGDMIRILGIKTSLSSINMKILCIHNFYCNQKSITELGMNYSSLNTAIKEAVDYFLRGE